MMKLVVLVVVMMMMMSRVEAFRSNRLMHSTRSLSSLKASESDAPEPDFEPEKDASLFNMNKRVRLGRSRDEDGKSNIWSIEPTMKVEEEDEDGPSGGSKNLFIGAAVIATAIAALPLFNAFSGLFPDPADF